MNAYEKIRAALEQATGGRPSNIAAAQAALAALAELEKAAAEPVAEVGGDFALYWAGTGPIQPLIVRYNIKVGSFLYAAPPAPVAEIREVVVTDEMARRVYYSFDGDLRMAEAEQARLYLTAWRSELGPALGLVTREEMARSVEIRDTEIARLETDLELARIEVARLRDALDQSAIEYADLAVSAKSLEEHLHALVEVSEDSTIARARAVMNGDDIGEDEDAARAGNGGE